MEKSDPRFFFTWNADKSSFSNAGFAALCVPRRVLVFPRNCYAFPMTKPTAHFLGIKDLSPNRLATLFFLNYGEYGDNYVLVSSARRALNEYEQTCVFICDSSGEPTTWEWVYRRFDFDQNAALESLGYKIT